MKNLGTPYLYSSATWYMSNVAKRIHFRFRFLVEVDLLRFNFYPTCH